MPIVAPRAHEKVGAGLLAGGLLFFVGGGMHPSDDPPGLSLKEHLLLLYEDPSWYPSHAVLLTGMALIAASLIALVRGRTLAAHPRVQAVAKIAAITAALAVVSALLHLVSALDADRIAARAGTPLTDASLGVETLVIPAFGLAVAALAAIGAATHTLGNWIAAVVGITGGVAYALAAGTALVTDALNFLFPAAAGIAVWAILVGIGILRSQSTPVVAVPAAVERTGFQP
jgi:hypothetical protein